MRSPTPGFPVDSVVARHAAQSLRLLLILTEFPPRVGGMQVHALYLANSLVTMGHDVEVITYRPSTGIERADAPAYDRNLQFPVHRVLSRISHVLNLEIIELHVRNRDPQLVYASTVFYGAIRDRCDVPVVARSAGNDLLRPWIVYPFRPFSRTLSARWFEDHAYRYFRNLEYPERLEAIWRRARRRCMVASALCHNAVLSNSAYTSKLLLDIGLEADQIHEVVGGVDPLPFANSSTRTPALRLQCGMPQDAWVILTACRLVKKKAVDFLVDALPLVRQVVPKAHLLVVGSGKESRALRVRAGRSSCARHITFTGRVTHEAVPGFYALADVFVLASREWVHKRSGLSDVETMGRALCEANAAGVPVIAARSGGIPSVIQDGWNGLLFEPDDLRSFMAAVKRLTAQRSRLAGGLIANGHRAVRNHFDWSHIVNAHHSVFTDVLRAWRQRNEI